MQKIVAVACTALLAAIGLSGCSSISISDPAPVKIPSLAAHFAKSPDDAPGFTDLTRKPFIAEGIGNTTLPLPSTRTDTKSLAVFVSCASASKFSFELYAGTAKIGSGAGGDCKGANDAGYGINLASNGLPTALKIDVEKATAFEVTIYLSTEVIP
ncbi:hypothetical protein [Frondihabitans cladoniiphilus]